MPSKKFLFVLVVFGTPLILGLIIIGHWYWTSRLEKKALLPTFGEVPQFSLISESERTVSQNNFQGKISIVDFIFTQCAGACPVMSTKMSELQQTFSAQSNIQFISFSVDPEDDSTAALREYARQYNATPGKWIFLTGSKEMIYRLTKEGFHLGLGIEGDGIIHSQKFVLVDLHGAIRGYYDSDDDQAMKDLVRDATILAKKIEQ